MADRRSMADALSLTPETISFIQGAPATKPHLNPKEKRQPSDKPRTRTKARAPRDDDAEIADVFVQPARSRNDNPSATRQHQNGNAAVAHILVPLTTRLQYGTASILRRACLEQKLNGARPATQQEILEAAVQDWLRRNGYLKT